MSSGAAAMAAAEDSGKRERKQVNRFEAVTAPVRVFAVPHGIGCKLSDIPKISESVAALSRNSEELDSTHRVLYGGGRVKATDIKKHILDFCGLAVTQADVDALYAKLDALQSDAEQALDTAGLPDVLDRVLDRLYHSTAAVLRAACAVLHLSRGGGKVEMCHALARFLAKPSDSMATGMGVRGVGAPAKKKKAAPASAGKAKKAGKAKATKADRVKTKRAPSAYMLFSNDVRKSVVAEHPGAPVTEIAKLIGEKWHAAAADVQAKYKAQYESLKAELAAAAPEPAAAAAANGSSSKKRAAPADKPAKKAKTATAAAAAKTEAPAKRAAKAASSSKGAAGPTNAELAAKVAELVGASEGETVSLKSVRQALEKHFGVSLVDRKDEVRTLIESTDSS